MKEKLAKMTGKTIIIKNTVDKSILGGVKLRYSGIQLDGSVKTRLDTFEKSLKNTVI
jgi:F-type H+-transporting ATPase subunit delta